MNNIDTSVLTAVDGEIYAKLQKDDFVKWLCEDKLNGFTKEGATIIYVGICNKTQRDSHTLIDFFDIDHAQLRREYVEYNSTVDFCNDYYIDIDIDVDNSVFTQRYLREYKFKGCKMVNCIINNEIICIVVKPC